MSEGFKIAEAFVDIKAKADRLRSEVRAKIEEAVFGQSIDVPINVDKSMAKMRSDFASAGSSLGGSLASNIAPFILPAVSSIASLTGVLGLVPAAGFAAGAGLAAAGLGFSGFTDALYQGDSEAKIKKANEELAAMGPNARGTALEMRGLSGDVDKVKRSVQEAIFDHLKIDMGDLARDTIPTFRTGLTGVGESINEVIRVSIGWLRQSETLRGIDTIFRNTRDTVREFADGALIPVLDIITRLGVTGSQYLPGLAAQFTNAVQKADAFIARAQETGQLDTWIQNGMHALGSVWEILKNLASIMGTIASTPMFGPDLLSNLATITGYVADMLAKYPQLIPIIEGIAIAWRGWQIISGIISLIGGLQTALLILRTEGLLALIGPAGIILGVLALIGGAAYLIIHNWDSIKGFFASLWTTVVGYFRSAGSGVMAALGWVAALPGRFLGWLGGLASSLAGIASRAWASFTRPFVDGFHALSAFVALGPYEMGVRIGQGIGSLIAVGIRIALAFGNSIRSGFLATVHWVASVPGMIGSGLASLGGRIVSIASSAWHSFTSTTISAGTAAISWAMALPGRIRAGIAALPGFLIGVATSAWHSFVNTSISVGTSVISFVSGLPRRILSALGNLGGLLLGAGHAIIDGLLTGLKNAVGALWDFVSGIADGIASRKGPLPYDRALLIPHGNAIMDGLLEGLQSGHDRVKSFVSGVAGDLSDNLSTSVSTDWNATASASGLVGGSGSGGGGLMGPVTVNVTQVASSPMETGRFTALALRGI
jgi:hypothetical protein